MAGSFGFAALGTGADALASSARTRVRYWNLFQGGDGTNQVAMVDAFRKANPDVAVKDSTLTWGGPYYIKLAMAAAGNRAPDLAVMHQGRIPGFAPGRLLDPWDVDLLAEYGVREADFNSVLWRRGIVDGELYALPLDIHVQLNFYRKDVCEKAGLLDSDGRLPAGDPDEWFEILKAAKGQLKKGQQTLGLHANDQNFAWWFFASFYQQLGGTTSTRTRPRSPSTPTRPPRSWSSYLMTMPNGIATVQNAFGIVWPQLMAGGIIAGLPLIAAFVLFQSQIVRGVAHTGLAGQ